MTDDRPRIPGRRLRVDDVEVLQPCDCSGCGGFSPGERCEDCAGLLTRPADAGGCVCGGTYGEPYWTTV